MNRIIVAGACGRMGRAVVDALWGHAQLKLAAALDRPDNPMLGRDVGATLGKSWGVLLTSDVAEALSMGNCLIDFTRPEGTMEHLRRCRAAKVSMVIGTTGLEGQQLQQMQEASREIPVVYAPNMGLGVNVLFRLVAAAAQMLQEGFDVEIIEAHHRHKVDAPSGTALKLGEIIAQQRGVKLADHACHGRQGSVGARSAEAIGFSAIRGGDIVGDHTVLFASEGERIELTHKASSRVPYAVGALRAAAFVQSQKAGLYTMEDVLGWTLE